MGGAWKLGHVKP